MKHTKSCQELHAKTVKTRLLRPFFPPQVHLGSIFGPLLGTDWARPGPKMDSGMSPGRSRSFIDLRCGSKIVPTGSREAPGRSPRYHFVTILGRSLVGFFGRFTTETLWWRSLFLLNFAAGGGRRAASGGRRAACSGRRAAQSGRRRSYSE